VAKLRTLERWNVRTLRRADIQMRQRANASPCRCLVTGGAGFIGSNIVERLVEEGQSVRVLDNFSTGKQENIEPWLDRIELVEGDLRDLETVREAVEGVDYVLHQGAIPSVPRSVDDPMRSHESNATGTLNVLIAARDAGVKRVVYASSSSVYGDSPEFPKREEMATNPLSPYAVSKLAGENYCRAFHEVYAMETVCLRYFNVFGPRQDPSSQYAAVIPAFVTAMLDGERPVVYGDGLQSRDFTYVANVVEANLLACRADRGAGGVFNAACGERTTLLELLETLERVIGREAEPRFEAPRPGDVKHSMAAIERARDGLGYEPEVGFEEGLRRTVAFFSDQRRSSD
jgi:nucleoside-diphosphate-sugar epimerase